MKKIPKDLDSSFVGDFVLEGSKEPVLQQPAKFLKDLADTVEERPHYAQVALSTLPALPGKDILRVTGVVSARVVKGQGSWKGTAMSLSDAFGRRSSTLEKELRRMLPTDKRVGFCAGGKRDCRRVDTIRRGHW